MAYIGADGVCSGRSGRRCGEFVCAAGDLLGLPLRVRPPGWLVLSGARLGLSPGRCLPMPLPHCVVRPASPSSALRTLKLRTGSGQGKQKVSHVPERKGVSRHRSRVEALPPPGPAGASESVVVQEKSVHLCWRKEQVECAEGQDTDVIPDGPSGSICSQREEATFCGGTDGCCPCEDSEEGLAPLGASCGGCHQDTAHVEGHLHENWLQIVRHDRVVEVQGRRSAEKQPS